LISIATSSIDNHDGDEEPHAQDFFSGGGLSEFVVGLDSWHCWASGIGEGQDWQSWIDGTTSPIPGDPPPLDDIKPIHRRRLNTVARGAFYCAKRSLRGRRPTATVFCSAHGEGARAAGLLESIAKGEALSPNAFSLSVHNAVAGLFGIFHQDRAPSISIAAGIEGVGAAFLEGWCRLQESGDGEVLVVLYDDQMPDLFAVHDDAPPVPIAASFLLSANAGTRYRLVRTAESGGCTPHWAQIRELANFLQHGSGHLILQSQRARWTWTAL
jgi:hypothetical protein